MTSDINQQKLKIASPLKGRTQPMLVPEVHFVTGKPLLSCPEGMQQALFGLGCFWGAERLFWQTPGVLCTAVGYTGGITPNPTYEEVCSGLTGHNEVVLVNFDPGHTSYQMLLNLFWESHNPTQGMAQGNDKGTQYRSSVFTFNDEQYEIAMKSKENYQQALGFEKFPAITTEILPATDFYYAEAYHQQYLAKNPGGYCGLAGTGIKTNGQ